MSLLVRDHRNGCAKEIKSEKKVIKKSLCMSKPTFFSEDVCPKCLVFEQQKNFYVMHGQFKHYMQSLFPNMEN